MKKFNYLLGVAAITVAFVSCSKDEGTEPADNQNSNSQMLSENGSNPDEDAIRTEANRTTSIGYLYIEGNETGINRIHIFKISGNGTLTHQGTPASGGAGSGASLGSQGALAISKDHQWLFAVNAGDNTISSFRVNNNNGSIQLAGTISSGGNLPVSICNYQNVVYVVNSTSANICGFTFDNAGLFTLIPGSNRPLSSASAIPAQISFMPGGNKIVVTEKNTNKINLFALDAAYAAAPGNTMNSTGITPFGFAYARNNNFMVVVNASNGDANAGSATSYWYHSGTYHPVNGTVADNQTSACWIALTKYERFAFVTNPGSNSVSSYYIAPWGSLYLVHSIAASAPGALDLCVSSNNYYVYTINSGTHTVGIYKRSFLGKIDLIYNNFIIPEFAAGMVTW